MAIRYIAFLECTSVTFSAQFGKTAPLSYIHGWLSDKMLLRDALDDAIADIGISTKLVLYMVTRRQ